MVEQVETHKVLNCLSFLEFTLADNADLLVRVVHLMRVSLRVRQLWYFMLELFNEPSRS